MEKRKILLIDDEEDFCQIVKMNLELTGKFEIATQSDPAKALETAREFNPDLMILDFRMPQMHGSEVAQQFQQNPDTANIPIIFLTGMATRDELQKYGCDDLCDFVLTKPATDEEIINAIEKNLGQKTDLNFFSRLFNSNKEIKWRPSK
ncbi:MAG: response regulator [Candidatus Omnitrophica bacterium]|nr:response regulator [Candidatus Omnitrophota bacterium]